MDRPFGDRDVLYVADVREEDVVGALERVAAVHAAGSTDEALELLDRVGCAVIADSPDGNGLDVVAAVHDRDPDLPMVYRPPEDGDGLAVRATGAGATEYLPRSADVEALLDRVRGALETYDRRRRYRRNGDIFESMMSEFPVTLFVKDEEARHVMISDPPTGWTASEVIGKTDVDLYSDDDPVFAREAYEDDLEVIETGEPIVEQREKIDGEDFTVWNETTKAPWRDESGRVRGLVGITVDVTEREELEHELRRERARSERFARYIAHDLRNPLNVARGYLELARETGAIEPLADVEDALDRIEEVVGDVLALVGEDQPDSYRTPVPLYDPIQNAWETVDTRSATLSVDVPSETLVVAGRTHLQELLENLIRNAVEHGGESVTVRVGFLDGGFFVEDDGSGIPEGEREAILEYGYSSEEEGTGLGLAIVVELAEVYNWSLEVTESEAGGARFEFHDCLLVPHPSDRVAGDRIEIEGSVDIGNVTPSGTAERSGDTWIVRGAGEDIWSDVDEVHFAYAPLDGDGRITARLVDLERIEPYTKAGVMVRGGLRASAPLGYVGVTADYGIETLWSRTEGDGISNIGLEVDADVPVWLRAERVDEFVTVSLSPGGTTWTPIAQRRVALGEEIYAGLAVCSHRDGTLSEARFEDVAVRELE